MTDILSLKDFLQHPGVIFDVRSPAEYSHAHIPSALSLPLFSNEERALVGTAYKQQSKQDAISLGLKLVGPKLADFVEKARNASNAQPVKLYCWRGGMRSGAMTWLLNFAGIKTSVLEGGYKTFRRFALNTFARPYKFIVVSGMTGCGKTAILHALKSLGEQIIDIESLANHRGSAYGSIGMLNQQPTSEHFENQIALKLNELDLTRPVWVEDESRLIGTCHIPEALFLQLRAAPSILIRTPLEERLKRLTADYCHAPIEQLEAATMRISKHLGSQRTKELMTALKDGRLTEAVAMTLQYYDAAYTHSSKRHCHPLTIFDGENMTPEQWASRLQTYHQTLGEVAS